ncbi:MAG: hypothetical protein ABL982_09140 [Vicinamibacterales bacterium]
MDHAGAVLGPLLAALFLWFYPGSYRTLFGLTIIPGLVAVVLVVFVREDAGTGVVSGEVAGVGSGFSRTARSPVGVTASPALPLELASFFWVLTLFTLEIPPTRSCCSS